MCFKVMPWDCGKHEKKWAKYLRAIEQAQSSYRDCESECYKQVYQTDLATWKKSGITREMIQNAGRGVKYQIIDGKLYRSKECMFGPRCSGVQHFILQILDGKWKPKGPKLPNMEMVINVSDYPQISAHSNNANPSPIFSFSKDNHYLDIMYPAWTFWEGGPALSTIERTGIGRWDLKFQTLGESSRRWPWHRKKKVGFFRGSRTSHERDPLIYLSRKYPDMFNASYVKNQAWRSNDDTLGQPATEISLEDHCMFKYLYNFRGVAASFRFKHLFLCRSLVFHVGEEWLEFFYPEMKPWVHYVPVKTDLSDALELLEFALAKDHEIHTIAENGYKFIKEHLTMDDVTRYWYELLTEYAKLLKYTPTLDPELMHITEHTRY